MFQKLILIFILFIMNQSVGAHVNPEYARKKIGSNKALKIATLEIKRLVKEQRIGTSWLRATHLKSGVKEFGAEKEWVVTFQNKNIEDKKKKRLYVFINIFGDFVAANFTGR